MMYFREFYIVLDAINWYSESLYDTFEVFECWSTFVRTVTRASTKVKRTKPKPKSRVKLDKLKRTHKVRKAAFKRIGYDPSSVKKFKGI